jgi:hypothetical protein
LATGRAATGSPRHATVPAAPAVAAVPSSAGGSTRAGETAGHGIGSVAAIAPGPAGDT